VVPRVSGSLAAHYAPRTAMHLIASEQLAGYVRQIQPNKRIALFAQPSLVKALASYCTAWRTAPEDPAHYAHDLYASLRELDQIGADLIVVQAPELSAHWEAVNDRLQRAETGSGEK
jgi:L-threonylcarbamoyladenylate synthase